MEKNQDKGRVFLSIARSAISDALGQSLNGFIPHHDDCLQEEGACFVTLKIHGGLRGCIGSLEANRPLFEDIHANAVAAALHDPRFPPLTVNELAKVNIEISLLSPTRKLDVHNEEETIAGIIPGEDGVVFQYGSQKATFLPQVWEQLPDAHQFLAHLRIKAGLPPGFWHPDVLIYVYTVEKFSEEE